MSDHPQSRLVHYLSDVFSLEQQALVQMEKAPGIAGSERLAEHFRVHLEETRRQSDRIEERLAAAGGSPSRVKDAIMRLGGNAFVLFARSQPDTPGKLAAHAYSYEALEIGAYELLIRAARDARDAETERVASEIRAEETAMRDRLATDFDDAVEASLRATGRQPSETVGSYLADAHALEAQSIQLLRRGEDLGGDAQTAASYARHAAESEQHARVLERRLEALGHDASALKDVALRVGGLNWSFFFQALDDTPAKLAAFVYAVEHLEIAGYELLRRTAARAGDRETVALCDGILAGERAMADRVMASFDRVFAASRPAPAEA